MIRNTKSNDKVEIKIRRSKRTRVSKYYGDNYAGYIIEEDQTNLQEAWSSLNAKLWQEANNNGIGSLESNMIFHLVGLSYVCKSINFKAF